MQAPHETSIARPPVETLTFRTEPVSQYAAVFSELKSLLRELRYSARRKQFLMLTLALLVVLVVNMVGQVFLNRWQGGFYRAIEQKNLSDLYQQLIYFAELVLILLTVVVSQTWLHERLKINLRDWLANRLLDHWLWHGRAYRLEISSDDAVNPDQRIQEDVRNFSEMSADLGVGLVQSSLLLVSFIGVLWTMSQNIHFTWQGQTFGIPGYMVWVAILYACLGSWVTASVGRPLITLNEDRYAKEAHFRFSIVRVSESAESVAFYSGEEDERKYINSSLELVLDVMRAMSFALARLTWITSGYGWIMIVLPVLVALPGYLQGTLDLGGLMMVVGAFSQVQQSLRWFVDNFAKIADWRAALHRVAVFLHAVLWVDEYENQTEKIELQPHPEGHLSFEHLKISLVDGEVVIAEATAHVRPGERVLVTGESGSGKSTLLRAVGGLWPWGAGVICIPPREEMMFLPQKPYLPLGTLATALSYPKHSRESDPQEMLAVLQRVNLSDFAKMLDVNDRWDRLLSLGQQQRLAFARLLLHKPKWIFLDEATSALDDENQELMMSLFSQELKDSAVISIGHRPGLERYHSRSLHLSVTPAGTVLRRRVRPPTKARLWQRAARRFFRARA